MIEELHMTSLRLLFLSILKLGASAYGGPGMISQIKETAINRYGWVKEGEFMRGVALCQLIPGAIMVHIVTYIGYRVRGIWGALTAAVAFVLPAFVALLALSAIYFKFHGLWFMESIFKGLGAIVIAILLNACITFGKSVLKDWKVILISVFSFFAILFHLNIVLIFVLAAVAGLLLHPETVQAKALPPEAPCQGTGEEKPRLILLALATCIAVVLGLCYLIDPRIAHVSLGFSKIGVVAFGAFTAIPLIQHDMVDGLHWLSTKEFLDGIALGCVTPGPIMITATFVGYKVAGFWGASMATLGVFFPSFFILVLLIPYHDRLREVAKVRMMEQGVLGAFIGILALVLYNFGRTSLIDVQSILMALGAFIAIYKKISLPYILLVGVILSIIFWGLK